MAKKKNNFNELKKVAEELNEAKRKAKEFAQNKGREVVGSAFRGIFEKFPELGAFIFLAYTPYFNDGDACTYGIRGVFAVPSNDMDANYWDYEFFGSYPKELSQECKDGIREIWDYLESNEELIKDMFGDHVRVTITKNEVTITEHDHE